MRKSKDIHYDIQLALAYFKAKYGMRANRICVNPDYYDDLLDTLPREHFSMNEEPTIFGRTLEVTRKVKTIEVGYMEEVQIRGDWKE